MASSVICSVENCNKPAEKRGFCGMHYRRWHRHGDPCHPSRNGPLAERFWSYVQKTDACWLWIGKTKTPGGYGRIKATNNRSVVAHRLSWTLHYGSIPDGLDVCHRCDNPPCVRPDHLFLGTHAENMRDMLRKGRGNPPKGEKNHLHQLTDALVRRIRAEHASGGSFRALARKYHVNPRTVKLAVQRDTWKHV